MLTLCESAEYLIGIQDVFKERMCGADEARIDFLDASRYFSCDFAL